VTIAGGGRECKTLNVAKNLVEENDSTTQGTTGLRNDLVQISLVYSNFDDFDLIVIESSSVRGRCRVGDESWGVGWGGRNGVSVLNVWWNK